jgi:hypothetical protein
MTSRLPIPGQDSGTWGDLLNSFLEVSLYNNLSNGSDPNNGTLSPGVVGTSQLQTGSVTSNQLASNSVTAASIANNAITNAQLDAPTQTTLASVASKYTLPNGGIPYSVLAGNIPASSLSSSVQVDLTSASTAVQTVNTKSPTSGNVSIGIKDLTDVTGANGATNNQVLQYNSGSNEWTPGTVASTTVSDATSTTKGIVQLAGDLTPGTNGAANPSVTSIHLSSALPINQGGTGSATQNFVDLSNNQTISGTKTFSNAIAGSITGNAATATSSTTANTVITIPNLTGDVTSSGSNNATTIAKLQGTTISSPTGGSTSYLNASGTWTTPSGSTNATSIDGVTVTGSASASQVLTASSSAAASWSNLSASSINAAQVLAPTTVKTSAYTASPGDFVPVDASGGSVTVTLPTAPADKSRLEIKMINTVNSNAVTITAGGSDVFNKAGGNNTVTLNLLSQAVMLQYYASSAIWYVQTDDLPLTQLDVRYASLDPNKRIAPADRDNVSAIYTTAQSTSSLTSGTTYRFNCSSASISQTLPTAPIVGTTLSFKRTDSVAANTLSLVAGGSDSFGAASPTSISGAQSVTYVYGSDGAWHATASLLPIANLLTTSIANTLYSPLGIPAWQGNYQYVAGQLVEYTNSLYMAENTFTSTSSFNPSNWYLVGQVNTIPVDGTASDIQPTGNQAAGSTGKAADAGHIHPATVWQPSDSSLKAWSFDPSSMSSSTSSTTGGTVAFAKIRISSAQTISNVLLNIATAAINLNATGTECGVAIYDSTGGATQYAASGTGVAATAFGTTGLVTIVLTSPVTLQPGTYTVAWWCNVTTGGSQPAFNRGASNTAVNGGTTGSSARYGNAQTGVTTTPSLLSSMAAGQTAWWVALS